MSSRFAAALGAVALAAVMLAGPAHAHDGHDHGAAPPPVSKSIAPRGEAASDALELTAIPQDGTVAFYLDRFRTNEPIKGAVVEVETPEGPRNAKETDEAAYVLPAPWMTKPRIARPVGDRDGRRHRRRADRLRDCPGRETIDTRDVLRGALGDGAGVRRRLRPEGPPRCQGSCPDAGRGRGLPSRHAHHRRHARPAQPTGRSRGRRRRDAGARRRRVPPMATRITAPRSRGPR